MITDLTDDDLLSSRLVICHGLPGAGKTTWAKSLAAVRPNIVIVDREEIKMSLIPRKRRRDQYSFRDEKRVTEVQRGLILDAFSRGKTVVSTDSNLDHRFVSGLANTALDAGHEYSQKYFDVPIEECKKRNLNRTDELGNWTTDSVVDLMASKGYGSDGRIREFRIGREKCFAYDRGGSDDEKFLEDFNKRMLNENPPQGNLLANFDMDGTLTDTRVIADRHMSMRPREFQLFQESSEFAPANAQVLADALKARSEGLTISVTTARTDEFAGVTSRWLEKHGVPVTYLRMRGFGDPRPDYEVKAEMIENFRKDGLEIVHCWDDNPQAVAAFADAGIRVTEVPFHNPTPVDLAPASYPEVSIASPFSAGSCLRCGKSFKGEGPLGPTCRSK